MLGHYTTGLRRPHDARPKIDLRAGSVTLLALRLGLICASTRDELRGTGVRRAG